MTDEIQKTGHLAVRAPRDLLQRFSRAVKLADPDLSASDVIRGFMRWYVGDGSLPKLPPSVLP